METEQIGPAKVGDSFRDRHSNTTETGKRKWVYALKPDGKLYRYRQWLAFVYLVFFFSLPFIKISGLPAVQLNFPEAKFVLFGQIFWPDDFFIFAVAMIILIVFIAFFTVIYGRVFCGWVCPQTVFMEFVFRKIEWWIEGTPGQQKKLNSEPMNMHKAFKKGLKHAIYLLISFLIAHTFLSYILGAQEVLRMMREGVTANAGMFAGLVFFTLLFYFVFAFVRDIVCTTICPYGRLQSVLFDKDTMQVSYDYNRGEPRGKLKKENSKTADDCNGCKDCGKRCATIQPVTVPGDCIDCRMCVNVCPTGIDIRNGVQMECVGCTACIDACNAVMFKINRPPGLIRMASENQIAEKKPFRFNGKMKFYSVVLILLMGIITTLIFTRKSIDTTVSRVKGQLYQEVGADSLSNLFQAKMINKTKKDVQYQLKIDGPLPGVIKMVDVGHDHLKPESINTITFFVIIPRSAIQARSSNISVSVYIDGVKIANVKSTFLGPFI